MIPEKLRTELTQDSYYSICARKNSDCNGRITWEHCFMYAGRKLQEKFAIIPLCWFHHLGAGLDKKINRQIAVSRATKQDLEKYPRKNWNEYGVVDNYG